MKKLSQFYLPTFNKVSSEFGGRLLEGKRKSARPISIKIPMHLILKADALIFRKNLKAHKNLVKRFAKRNQIKVMAMAFNGNHIHLVIRLFHKSSYNAFVRAVTSRMTAIANKSKTFTLRPYTRFIQWGKDLKQALTYIDINNLEADGIQRNTARLLLRDWNSGPPKI